MPDTKRPPVKFERPPIVEVVCGVSFELPKPLTSAYIGLYWSKIKSGYPNTLDQAPIPATFEGPMGAGNIELQFLQLPPLRRTFFSSPDGRHLVQVQDDRFLLNWKKVEDSDQYPSYANVIHKFREHYVEFVRFLEEMDIGTPKVTQLELTYVNLMEPGADANSPASSLLVDHQLGAGDRFLPRAETINWQTSYPLPEQSGRLHTVAQSVRKAQKPSVMALRLDLTARGLPKVIDQNSCNAWFDMAHEWITHGFADITSPQAHQSLWRRTS